MADCWGCRGRREQRRKRWCSDQGVTPAGAAEDHEAHDEEERLPRALLPAALALDGRSSAGRNQALMAEEDVVVVDVAAVVADVGLVGGLVEPPAAPSQPSCEQQGPS